MEVSDLTREEARERAALLSVQSYRVGLDFTRGDKEFGSTSEVRFTSARVGASTYVDLVAERVHEATLNGEPIDLSGFVGDRLALTNLAADNVLVVSGDFAYTHESRGVHRSVDAADGKVYLFTEFFPAEARRVFAVFDQPDLKATFTFALTAPEHWLVLSNTPAPEPVAAEPVAAGPGVATWQFPATPRLSSYVASFVAGEYTYVRDTYKTQRGQVIPLGVACRASLAEHLEADDMFEITRQGLEFYTNLFDMDFPFAKYDQIFVPEFYAGAMENAACVTFSENYVFRSKTSSVRYQQRARTVLHEMAHMWFGDLVTMRWWGDLWLNESFADFCGAYASVQATKYTDAWVLHTIQRKTWGYGQDRLPSTHPVVADAPSLAVAVSNFDGISYAKGGSILKQLVAYVGPEAFFAGVRAYFAEHAWANAEFADLVRALENSSGKDLRDWASAWLETSGPSTLRAEFELDDAGRFTAFAVRQQAPAERPVLRPHHIIVGFYDRQEGEPAMARVHRVEIDLTGEVAPIPELVGRPRPDVILLNDDDLGYALTRFDPASLAVVTEQIGAFPDALTRAVAWTSVLDMVGQAELSVADFIRMLGAGLRAETSIELVQVLHRAAEREITRLADPAWLPTGLTEVAGVAIELLRAAEPGGDFQLSWAQMLAWSARSPEQLDLLAGLLDGTAEIPGLEIGTELRWLLLHRLVATGRRGEEAIEAELARDATDTGKRRAQSALAAIPDAAHKAAAWALLTESDELGVQGIRAVAEGFGEPEHAELLAPYADKFFDVLPELWRTRSGRMRKLLAEHLYPFSAAGDEVLRRSEEVLADPETDSVLGRVIVESRDLVRRVIKSRAL
jgi:aminopeptidase N